MAYLKLVQQVRGKLKFANQKFSRQIKKDKNISANYIDIAYHYRTTVKLLETIPYLSAQLEFYKLQAEFGFLQCEVNSFQLFPRSSSAVQQNEDLLAVYPLQLQRLFELTFQLENKLSLKGRPNKRFNWFKKELTRYIKKWEKYENDLKAAYYFNYANHLLSKIPVLKMPGSIANMEQVINYFQQASACYASNSRQKEKEETDNKITEAKDLLIQLQTRPSQLKVSIPVSIPLFLIPKIQVEKKQAISIENKPLIANSLKIKTLTTNPPPNPVKNLKSIASDIKPYTKKPFFRPKKESPAMMYPSYYPLNKP